MKKLLIFGWFAATSISLFAGNPDRIGQAGATQLLINPWARSSGFNGMNVAASNGIESVINNPAGLAGTRKTELVFSHSRWLSGSSININSFGMSQATRGDGVIGISVMAFDFGQIERTTEDNPDGGLGTFSPSFLNIGASYAKKFTDHINVGFTTRMIHEAITDASATGISFDAGVQYKTGGESGEKLKFGVSLRNVGPAMRFAGDGLQQRANLNGNQFSSAVSRVGSKFELPSYLAIGVGYDFDLAEDHVITALGSFYSHTFSRDQLGLGAEYRFRKFFMLRTAYSFEKGIFADHWINDKLPMWIADSNRMNVHTGLSLGCTFEIPFKSGKDQMSKFAVDYAYRSSNPFAGTHNIGLRIDL
jgi:hypothetical protein